jgi:hypothetical protein
LVCDVDTPISLLPKRNRRGFGYDYDSPTGVPDEDQYDDNSPARKRQKVSNAAEDGVPTPALPAAGPSSSGARQGAVPEPGPAATLRLHNGTATVGGGR